jgi:hypothetical protein
LGADIEIDGNFVGSTPSSVGIVAGEHTLRVSKSGYRKWERTLKSSTGKIKIAARLEPIPIDASATSHAPTEVAAIRDPAPPANSSEGVAVEARIGIWLTGNPTARHDGIEISGVQPEGPAAVLAYNRVIYFSLSTATISIPSTISAPTFYDASGVRDWQYDIDTADSPTTITSYSPLTMGLSIR